MPLRIELKARNAEEIEVLCAREGRSCIYHTVLACDSPIEKMKFPGICFNAIGPSAGALNFIPVDDGVSSKSLLLPLPRDDLSAFAGL